MLISTPTDENLDILDRNLSSNTKMFFDIKLGGTAMLNETIGLRAQALMQFPIDWAGAYFGIGTGGPSTGVSRNSTVLIFSLQGGIVLVIPQ